MSLTPLAAIVRGCLAGMAGTVAMDLVWYARHRRSGGEQGFVEWELSAGLTWEEAPAPAQVGRRVIEGFLQKELPPEAAPLVNNLVHWQYGAINGAAYGILAGSLPGARVRHGLLLGSAAWLSGYVFLPLAGLYKPIWEYDTRTLTRDWSAHLVYGVVTAATFRVLAARSR